jgi:hypothetical protein
LTGWVWRVGSSISLGRLLTSRWEILKGVGKVIIPIFLQWTLRLGIIGRRSACCDEGVDITIIVNNVSSIDQSLKSL